MNSLSEMTNIRNQINTICRDKIHIITASIKKILSSNHTSDEASLLQLLDAKLLNQIGQELSSSQKEKLNELFNSNITNSLINLKRLYFFINKLILTSADASEQKRTIINLLNDATDAQIINLCLKNKECSQYIFTLLNSGKLSSILSKMDNKDIGDIMGAKVNNSDENERKTMDYIKDFFSNTKAESPILKQIKHSILSLSPDKEKATYESLKSSGKNDLLEELALSSFPVFLIEMIPEQELQRITEDITSQDIVEFLKTNDLVDQEKWLKKILPGESKKKEMITMELDLYNSKEAKNNKNSHKINFYSKIKSTLKSSQYKNLIISITDEYIAKG